MGVVVSLVAALSAAAGSPAPLTVREVMAAPHAPVLEVVDTVSSLGPLAARPQTITIADLVRFHGHPCDGLVAAAAGMAYGLQRLFPGGIVDRTDLAVTVNRSACYGDVAAYLTGARHRYGSLVIDPKLGDEWILRRRSTGTAVRVRLRPGVKPAEIPALEKRLRHADCPADLIARVQQLQRSFALAVVSKPPAEVFEISTFEPADGFPGTPRPDALKRGCPCGTGGTESGASEAAHRGEERP